MGAAPALPARPGAALDLRARSMAALFPLPFQVRLRILPAVHVEKGQDAEEVTLGIQSEMQRALIDMST